MRTLFVTLALMALAAAAQAQVPPPPEPPKQDGAAPGAQDPAKPEGAPQEGAAAAPQTEEEKKKAEEEKAKAAEEAKKKQEEAQKKALDQKFRQQTFQMLQKLPFDRRPAAILAAWSAPEGDEKKARDEVLAAIDERVKARERERWLASLTPEQRARFEAEEKEAAEAAEKAKAEEKPNPVQEYQAELQKRMQESLAEYQRDVTLGHWDEVRQFLSDLPPDQGPVVYQHLLTQLDLEGGRQPVEPTPGQLREVNVISPEDFKGLADASPLDLTPDALVVLASLLNRCLAQGHELKAVAKEWDAGTRRLGGQDWFARVSVAALLVNAGYLDEATTFLPTVAESLAHDAHGAVLLLVRYHRARHAEDKEPKLLEQAWETNQELLAAGGLSDVALAVALTNAAEMAPDVRDTLGAKWMEESFTKNLLRGRQVLATIGAQVAGTRTAKPKDTDARTQGLELQQTVVRALLQHNPAQAVAWGEMLTVLAKNWLHEAEFTAEKAESQSGRRQFRRDYYGNVYYYSWSGQRAQNQPDPVPAGEMLRLVPADDWIARVDPSLHPHVQAVRARLHLKVGEDEAALPFVEALAKSRPRQAHDLAEQALRLWIENNDLNANNSNRTQYYYYMWGFDSRSDGIPLTRSKQERNLSRLAAVLDRLRALPIEPIDDDLVAEAFIRMHSAAEVYRLENLTKVFGNLETLSPKTLARLIQTMRTNLAGIWKDPRVQNQEKTKRTDAETAREVAGGYATAAALAAQGLAKHPDSWELKLARATAAYDQNHFANREVGRSAEFAAGRTGAYALFAEAAAAYAAKVAELKDEDRKNDVFDHWFYAALGASDLPRVLPEHVAVVAEYAKIQAALDGLPGDLAKTHRERFASQVFARLSSANPGVKMSYLEGADAIVSRHDDAAEAWEVLRYYGDLVTEIHLDATIDGSDRVGHGRPFGVFIDIRHTKEIEREAGGFAKYLQNQNAMGWSWNYGRPTEDYRGKFEEAAREVLKEHFEVLSVTFHESKIESRGTPNPRWRVTPYAYVLLKTRDAATDTIPPVKIDFDFMDTSGYVVLPVRTPALPIDAKPGASDPRPTADVEITQTLDERRAGEGQLVLEVRAKGHGLMPPLDELLGFDWPDFEVTKTEDNGVAVKQLDAETQDNLVISEREFTMHLKGREGLSKLPKEFTFGATKVDGATLVFQRYQDADLQSVAATVSLEQVYGTKSYAWVWVVALLLLAAGVGGFFVLRAPEKTGPTVLRWELPVQCTPFTVIDLLRRIAEQSPLAEPQKAELTAEIARIQAHYFAAAKDDEGPRPDLDLAGTARAWAARAPAAPAGANGSGGNGAAGSQRA